MKGRGFTEIAHHSHGHISSSTTVAPSHTLNEMRLGPFSAINRTQKSYVN